MKLLLFLLVLVGLVAGCQVPLNNVRFLPNETHDSAALLQDSLLGPAGTMGYAEVVSLLQNPHTTWPGGFVRYCYPEPSTRAVIENHINSALKIWSDKIGIPNEENGHNLFVHEHSYNNPAWPYCYLERKDPDRDPWTWNPEVPWDTVVIAFTNVGYMFSTTGYIPHEWSSDAARHRLYVNVGNMDPLYLFVKDLAHEFGHIFGLWHEHSRIDRDYYVHFECRNLYDYAYYEQKVKDHPLDPSHNIELLCKDCNIANLYGWSTAAQYSTVYQYDPIQKDGHQWPWVVNYDREDYDELSIMHYDSWMSRDATKDDTVMANMPLVGWLNTPVIPPPDKVTQENAAHIGRNFNPSDDDQKSIKYLYPWHTAKRTAKSG